jgi:hypothetical protein
VPYRSPGGHERPSHFAELIIVTEPLSPGEPADIEQPTILANLTVLTVKLEPLAASEPPDIEQPSHLAEWVIAIERLSPWDELKGPFPPGET